MQNFFHLNDHSWTENLSAPLSPTDHAAFQAKLDELVPPQSDGTKRLQLVWNPSYEIWDPVLRRNRPVLLWRFKVDGTELIEGIVRPKYVALGVPRYIVMGKIAEEIKSIVAPAEYYDNENRLVVDKPEDNEYIKIIGITEHSHVYNHTARSPQCCLDLANSKHVQCFGAFRFPDDNDIAQLRDMFGVQKEVAGAEAGIPLTMQQKLKLYHERMKAANKEKANRIAEVSLIKADTLKDDWYRRDNLTKRGKFSIPGLA